MNSFLLSVFITFLFLSYCNVNTYTVPKTLHVSHLKRNLTTTTESPIAHTAPQNQLNNSNIVMGEIPEMTTKIISLNKKNRISAIKSKTNKEAKKTSNTNMFHKNKKTTHNKKLIKISKNKNENFSKKNMTQNIKNESNNTTSKEKKLTVNEENKKQINQTNQNQNQNQKQDINTVEANEEDEEIQDSLIEIKQKVKPIFKEISYLDDFQDFLKTQIDKINMQKIDYDSFSFD